MNSKFILKITALGFTNSCSYMFYNLQIRFCFLKLRVLIEVMWTLFTRYFLFGTTAVKKS